MKRSDRPPGSIILVDSSALVYLVEGESSSPRRLAVEAYMARAAAEGKRVFASTIAWAELLEGPLARGDLGLADRYRQLLADSSRIELREVDVAVAQAAAELAAALPETKRRKLSSGDLLQIATALALGAQAVLTNDEAWRIAEHSFTLVLVDELAAELEAEQWKSG